MLSAKRIFLGHRDYPKNLGEIDQPPQFLYVLGELKEKDFKAIAIVGSRHMSQRGEEMAFQYAYFFASFGFTIVSGLARGIDTVAHKAALAAEGGRTIAVLGNGLNTIYPPENNKLAQHIISRGALISEFSPRALPDKQNFLLRNRIVSGLSRAVLVIEGDRRSGTLNTASHAANQNRDVYAIPGSSATDYLIENGAIVVNSPEEMLAHFSWQLR